MTSDTFSAQQRRVYDRLVLGDSNQEIATALSMNEKTVKSHVTWILAKLNCVSRCKVIARHYQEKTV